MRLTARNPLRSGPAMSDTRTCVGSINEILMAYQTQQIHLHSRIAIPARALKKESFTEEQNKKYLLTTVVR